MAPRREEYTVGYGKPPKQSQFKKGQSGNPKGQRRGTPKTLRMIMDEIFAEKVRVRENGRSRLVSTRQAIIMRLRAKAARGNRAAINVLLDYIRDASAHQELVPWEIRFLPVEEANGG